MSKSESIERKFIQSYDISDYEIMTDTGWKDISAIHKTVKYRKFTIETQTGKKLSGADNHIVFKKDLEEVFLCELKIGDKIVTEDGYEKIISVIDEGIEQNMYDVTVDSEQHRFYSNGILSHNSTSYSAYVLWYVIVNQNKNVLICANREKTAVQILGRIKMAYEMLPNWLKPAVIKWNAKCVEFSNGCKISAEATSEDSGRGQSINCIAGSEFVTIKENNKIFKITLKELEKSWNSNQQILTDTGWSEFSGVINKGIQECIKVNLNDSSVICTPEHKIFDKNNQEWKQAQTFQNIQKINKQEVYDIINVEKNNRFLINDNILVHNCLLLDEFAFIAPNMEQAFMQSVFPVVSSSKKAKIIIVSTPKGTNNEYYRIWNKAILNTDPNNKNVWHANRIDWWDVPGRDEEWKEKRLAEFNNDVVRFRQEYGNCVLGNTKITVFDTILKK